jgi:uncharacterized protein YqgQ
MSNFHIFGNNYSKVGIAFDYVLGTFLKRLNQNAYELKWGAEMGIEKIKLNYPNYYKTAKSIIKRAKKLEEIYIEDGQFTDELLKSFLLVARLDRYFRSGYFSPNLDKYDKKDIDDLRNLITSVDTELFKANEICITNPRFGSETFGSDADILIDFMPIDKELLKDIEVRKLYFYQLMEKIPTAEADLIIDDMLIEIKTTKDPTFRREYFNQLMGYYMFYRLFGVIGYPQDKAIKRIGLYSSRYAHLSVYNVDDIVDENKFPEFCRWFIKKTKYDNF